MLNTKLKLKEEQLIRCRQQNEEIFEFAKANQCGVPEIVRQRQNEMVSTMIALLHAISEKMDERIVDDQKYREMMDDTKWEKNEEMDSNTVEPLPISPFVVPVVEQMNGLWHR